VTDRREHTTDPKMFSITKLRLFKDLTTIAELTSTLLDHNHSRAWAEEELVCRQIITWTVVERNKIAGQIQQAIVTSREKGL